MSSRLELKRGNRCVRDSSGAVAQQARSRKRRLSVGPSECLRRVESQQTDLRRPAERRCTDLERCRGARPLALSA